MRKTATIAVALLVACGCGETDTPTVAGRWYTEAQVEAGKPVYAQNCADCHGADGSATPDWRTPGPDGHYPPPPLNGTAHTWHHALDQLDRSISVGGSEFGGVMPGFEASLARDQRLAVIAYIQTWWPDDIYARWRQIESR